MLPHETTKLGARPLPEPANRDLPIVFVGGTGRSGTHVVARLLGRHSRLLNISNEVRFHVDPGGFPDLLAGRTSADRFVRRLRGRWWRGLALQRLSLRGLFRHVDPGAFDDACAAFRRDFDEAPEAACRALFFALLGPLAVAAGKPGIVEQSCDTIAQAQTLHRLFPEAKFIHVVRDGRDTAASRVAQARWLARPRTLSQGIEWWDGRMRRIDVGVRAVPNDQFLAVSLDELVELRRRATYHRLRRFVELKQEPLMRRFFRQQMSGSHGNVERWRRRMSPDRQRLIGERYVAVLDGLERDSINGYRMLRRVHSARAGR